ncbi:hypothetical protein FCM35_KLT04591 [Carex littledalei]|uniref:Uncharacterized protein n=1 Tax=Carex littledalei TaxID=544730 RepID=A0A833R330_9POAL|nr:hypothetical protein FCM35_KLT04591 [Carex littledalei]
MGRIHAIMSDGTVVTDVEAFRKIYEAVGLGWVYAITKFEPVAVIANAIYGVWAKYRLQITVLIPNSGIVTLTRTICHNSTQAHPALTTHTHTHARILTD